jgi:undecaprenyl-phosphate galactose phosphotransferase/putative colanic acid biosynthesis UDP-glucose lipid carrier transferase
MTTALVDASHDQPPEPASAAGLEGECTSEFVDAPIADGADAVERSADRKLSPDVVPFDRPQYRRPISALQSTGARIVITLAEAGAILVASFLAGLGYYALVLNSSGNPLVFLSVGLLAAIFFSGSMRAIESNQRLRRLDSLEAMRDVTFVWIGTILCVTFFAFSLKAGGALSRGSMITFMVLGYFVVVGARTITARILSKHYRPGRLIAHQIIVVGVEGDPSLETVLAELKAAGYAAPRIVRFNARVGGWDWQRELSISVARLIETARTTSQGEICIAAGGFDDSHLRDIVVALQVVPRAVRLIPTPAVEQLLHHPIRSLGGLHSVELQRAPLGAGQLLVKRALDLALASGALLFLAPVLLAAAVAIKLGSRGPVLFKQTRLGHRGVPFAIFKFRTMNVAENDDATLKQATVGDKRVTRIGRFLRKASIDELPQLINVIRGEMSLVGPRPHPVALDRHYSQQIENYEIRQHVKPGITGWAQVNGLRGETSAPNLMRRRVEADVWYAKNASILLDFRILLLTVVEVLRQRNAY